MHLPAAPPLRAPDPTADRLALLEDRVARLEAQLATTGREGANADAPAAANGPLALETPAGLVGRSDELEFQVGQNWFAVAGVAALTLGAGFLLTLPFAGLAAGVPSIFGYVVVGVLFTLAHAWRRSFAVVAVYLRGAAMVLLCFATLRLFYPAAHHVLSPTAWAARGLLVTVAAINVAIAWRRHSIWLMNIALATGGIAALAGGVGFGLAGAVAIAAVAAVAGARQQWPGLALAAIPMAGATYLACALGNPFFGSRLGFVAEPAGAPVLWLGVVALLALPPWWLGRDGTEAMHMRIGAALNCGVGYGLFLGHTLVAHNARLAPLHLLASGAFLAIAVAYWIRHHCRVATFFYAMTGYAALSIAILKLARGVEVFVWLALQSVVVIATAIWFRSRLIVVANFLIYVAIVLGYMITAKVESGHSVGFGFVALISARILNWQQHRLELKTELMRNAYLVSAFVVFPYALAHLVPGRLVALAWVGLALAYYAMNLFVRSPKYRWMGHATLILTTLYVMVIGISRFEPVYRVLSFFALGVVLLLVSLSFTRARQRRQAAAGQGEIGEI